MYTKFIVVRKDDGTKKLTELINFDHIIGIDYYQAVEYYVANSGEIVEELPDREEYINKKTWDKEYKNAKKFIGSKVKIHLVFGVTIDPLYGDKADEFYRGFLGMASALETTY